MSPYDETLVIDSDFIICSDNLTAIWDNSSDFAIYKDSYDISRWRMKYEYINQYSVPFYWATVFYFKKTPITESFFTLINHIRENWNYYRLLYCVETMTYRNDYAFSIAISIMNGGTPDSFFASSLPGKLYYAIDKDIINSINNCECQILVEKESFPGEYIVVKTSNLDVHLMNKYSLERII